MKIKIILQDFKMGFLEWTGAPAETKTSKWIVSCWSKAFPCLCLAFHSDLSVWDDSINKGKDGGISAECSSFSALPTCMSALFSCVSFDCLVLNALLCTFSSSPNLTWTLKTPSDHRGWWYAVISLATFRPLSFLTKQYLHTQVQPHTCVWCVFGQRDRQSKVLNSERCQEIEFLWR